MLLHGGLAEPIGADRFWIQPGIVRALQADGLRVDARDRNTTPPSWAAAASELAGWIPTGSTVVAASNAVSVAMRLVLDHTGVVDRLVLLWPATAGDAAVDDTMPPEAAHLLAGETLRGVTDAEFAEVSGPVAVMPSEPENPTHQRQTVDRLVALLPHATLITPGFPESPLPAFVEHLDDFIDALLPHL